MPRKWLETVHPWPPLRPGTWYALRVTGIEKCADPPSLRVHLDFFDADQAGRSHTAVLLLPVRPAGLTAAFFQACGMETSPGNALAPHEAVGWAVRVQFGPATDDLPAPIVAFSPPTDARPAASPEAEKGRRVHAH
jgi:hypothetical protein